MGFDSFSQTTAIPDDKFEQALIDLKIDTNGKNNTILNSDAVAVDSLIIIAKGIANLSGIEAFTSLTFLNCWLNQLTSLDVSSNTDLTILNCTSNELTSLNVSSNVALAELDCSDNQLTTLNLSTNTVLRELFCGTNQLTNLDVSANKKLTRLSCVDNKLTNLNVKNKNNNNFTGFNATGNPNLSCIQVDDVSSSILDNWNKDATAVYSEDCSALSNEDFKLAEVSISPNPTSGVLNITTVEKADYRLFNIKGQILKKGVLVSGESKIDISSLSKGIYLLNLKTNKGSFTKKVVRN